jgi:hypothetical protein
MGKNKNKSLCKQVEGKALKKDPAAYKKLVDAPRFVCLKCGRAANDKKNLCDPTML